MGTFTDNLLKLTEFPFSYSFIGLLALMFGQGLNFGDEQYFNTLGPLLILMGFVATTLSITDPVGVLQKVVWLRGLKRMPKMAGINEFESIRIFGVKIGEYFVRSGEILSGSLSLWALTALMSARAPASRFGYELRKMNGYEIKDYYDIFMSLRDSTLRTTWVRREVDKITSMGYFIVVILTFISALFLLPNFEDKFLVTFQGGNQTQGDGSTVTGGDTTTTMATNTAASANTTVGSEETSLARITIFAFSMIALGAVSYMLIRRLRELKRNAHTAFDYLLTREAYLTAGCIIKIEDEDFEKSLREIEQYLDNSDWTLARVLVNNLTLQYERLFSEKWDLELDRKKEEDKEVNYQDLGIY